MVSDDVASFKSHQFTRNLFPKSNQLAHALFEVINAFTWTKFSVIYENEESLLRLYDILQEHEMAIKSLTIYKLPSEGDFRPFLKQISRSGINRFVVDCGEENWKKILNQGKQFNLTREYIVGLLLAINSEN